MGEGQAVMRSGDSMAEEEVGGALRTDGADNVLVEVGSEETTGRRGGGVGGGAVAPLRRRERYWGKMASAVCRAATTTS